MTVRWHPAGAHRRLRALVAERVRERIDAVTLARATPPERRVRVGEEALAVLREHRVVLSARDLTRLVNDISDEVVGLGPIESLLKDPEVSEVMVNGADDVYVERKGPYIASGGSIAEGESKARRASRAGVTEVPTLRDNCGQQCEGPSGPTPKGSGSM